MINEIIIFGIAFAGFKAVPRGQQNC